MLEAPSSHTLSVSPFIWLAVGWSVVGEDVNWMCICCEFWRPPRIPLPRLLGKTGWVPHLGSESRQDGSKGPRSATSCCQRSVVERPPAISKLFLHALR